MIQTRPFAVLACAAACAAALTGSAFANVAPANDEPAGDATWRQKVDPWVFETTRSEALTEFLVVLDEQADVSGAAALATKREKGRFVFDKLNEVADRTQGPVLASLRGRGVDHRPYWVANMIWVRADQSTVEAMARRADVARVHANPRVALDATRLNREPDGACPPTVEASLTHVGATDFWAQGVDGTGVVVGGQDTGYDWDHEALQANYRGWDGTTANHDFHWHDAIHSGGGVCGADSVEPCDDNGHGSHTMGTMIGNTPTSNIGMAPGAKWIGCRNMDQGNGTPTTYSECFQFFLAPTDLAGQNANPDMAPDVINNSWGCPPVEGCTDPNVMQAVVENLRAAGVVVVVSAGNSGSSCGTVNWPAPIYDAAYSVGATDLNDNIAGFSSRGPVTVDGSNRLKPDISAPGVNSFSSFPGGSYGTISGTSMAGPHVAGLVALLIDADGCLRGNQTAIEDHINETAAPRTSTQTCGGVSGSQIPNNTFGYGVIRAVMPTGGACGQIFGDGFESGDTLGWSSTSAVSGR